MLKPARVAASDVNAVSWNNGKQRSLFSQMSTEIDHPAKK